MSPAVVAMATVFAALIIAKSNDGLLRALGALVIIAGPGMAWVPLLDVQDRVVKVLLYMLCSVSAVILVAQAVTYIAFFSWRPCEFTLIAITLLGLLTESVSALLRARKSQS
jgi:hypothetical protein